jgi:hypothetical protein
MGILQDESRIIATGTERIVLPNRLNPKTPRNAYLMSNVWSSPLLTRKLVPWRRRARVSRIFWKLDRRWPSLIPFAVVSTKSHKDSKMRNSLIGDGGLVSLLIRTLQPWARIRVRSMRARRLRPLRRTRRSVIFRMLNAERCVRETVRWRALGSVCVVCLDHRRRCWV